MFQAFSASGRLSTIVAAAPSRRTMTVCRRPWRGNLSAARSSTSVDKRRRRQRMLTAMSAQERCGWPSRVDSTDPAVGLRAVASLRTLVERLEALHVAKAREPGWSWQQVGGGAGCVQAGGPPQARPQKEAEGLMFEGFTTDARAVVERARAEAQALGHARIGTEHLAARRRGRRRARSRRAARGDRSRGPRRRGARDGRDRPRRRPRAGRVRLRARRAEPGRAGLGANAVHPAREARAAGGAAPGGRRRHRRAAGRAPAARGAGRPRRARRAAAGRARGDRGAR